jgi:Fe-S-cluster containining protein
MRPGWDHLLNFRCTCCGDCCREPIVLVTDADIRRIVTHTGQPIHQVAAFYAPDDIEWGRENDGWIRLDEGWRILGLRRTDDGCQYLRDDDLCGIYDHRPVTCRRYPFDVEFGGRGDLTLLRINDAVECPHELDGRQTPAAIRALVDWEDREESPYFDLVRTWNRIRPAGSADAFLSHIGL